MIRGVHTMFYSSQPEALRAFMRDKLQLPFSDVGQGWLIFDLPEADMGCHPADEALGGSSGTHNISFYCDNVEKTMAQLQKRGVEFTGGIEDRGYGLVTFFKLPGDFTVQLYQPRYTKKSSRKPTKTKKTVKAKTKRVTATRAKAKPKVKSRRR